MQIEEVGTIETPMLITGTLNVSRVADALLTYLFEQAPEIGRSETVGLIHRGSATGQNWAWKK